MTGRTVPGDPDWRRRQRGELLRLVRQARVPAGYGWLDVSGAVVTDRPAELWITCRMTHVAALAALVDEPPAPGGPDRDELLGLAAHGVASLQERMRDARHGGWYAAVGPDGAGDVRKQAYGHAFVLLAASSASAADVPGAERLLHEANEVVLTRFWDDEHGLVVDEWDETFTHLSGYRGVNANMHAVEAFLAVGDVTGDERWRMRASRVAEQVASWARASGWRVPEHFDSAWRPLPDHHRDQPAHPFQPYGATVGHGLEWARLLVATAQAGAAPVDQQHPLVRAALALYDRAVADGWARDGADGFVYTTDWDGEPVVRQRMHWVLAEALNAAEVLDRVVVDPRYAADRTRWWAYAEEHLVDHEHGSWFHELDPGNRPAGTVWCGKPDVYHAYQALLLPDLPENPSFAASARALAAVRGI